MEISTIQSENDGFSGLENWFNTVSHTFDRVYVSFGSKYNASHIYFQYPETIKSETHYTNATYQMVPTFMRHHEKETARHLAIVIDDFNQPNSLEENIQFITRDMQMHAIEHITILFVNKQLSPLNIANCLSVTTHFIERQQIDTKNVMFANYIHFQRPNESEERIEKNILSSVSKILNTLSGGIYKNRFYQWYGMQFYSYNYIYSYQEYYHICAALDMSKLQAIVFRPMLCNSKLESYEYDKINQFAKTQSRSVQSAWENFKQYSINLIDDYIA